MQIAGDVAPFLLLQREQMLVQPLIVPVRLRKTRRHPVETVAQAGQLRRQSAADPRAIVALADLFQGRAQTIQRAQRMADQQVDEEDGEAAEKSERDQALAELIPDLEDLVARVGFDDDGS